MYTPDIENRQHRSMPEHRRIGIVKSPIRLIKSMQRHSDNPCWTAVVVIDVGGRPAGGVGNFKWRRNGQVSDTTVVTRNWSACYLRVVDGMAALCCGRLIGVFQMANDLRRGNYLRSTLFVQQRAPCWCTILYSDSLGASTPLSGYVISMANAVLQHLTT